MRAHLIVTLTLLLASAAFAQQVPANVGFVAASAATVSGDITVSEERVSLGGSTVVTAGEHMASVSLNRGGTVSVCQSSSLHLTKSELGTGLLLALDRGALELHFTAGPNDVLMTPDFRFSVSSGGPLDLRLRVTRSGDTCVENRGRSAPAIQIADPFGEGTYVVNPGQHVLFEHGQIGEVVDREPTPCGCPDAAPPPTLSIAEAIVSAKPVTPAQAEAQHPFPAAVSEGLAAPTPLPARPAGQTQVQVSAGLAYNGNAPPIAIPLPRPPPPPPPDPPRSRNPLRAVGHFFRRVFGTD